ncbi:RluA family pseudouridine synthase [Sporosarcina sp. Marseille-Q4063]|uniref:RluA family pseudouridine synthase n=1 Tax=Sporosarcina sp. Marseille-Q4063 TaxID=2810514 RepID=UPI002738DEA6|nr:RluA family pseudouridine synthase [Sporosarcina sp. Marseille-Q4063]
MVKNVDSRFHLSFNVNKDRVQLRDFLGAREISKRTLTAVKYNGGLLLVNGIERDVRHFLYKEDRVDVYFPPEETSAGLKAEEGNLSVVFEDDFLLILDKPARQSTIPSFNHRSGTIANFVAGKFLNEQIPSTVHIVTRLDHNTSGLVCIAKNRHIHHLLGKQVSNSTFKRSYTAIVEGHFFPDQMLINEAIGRKDGSIIERVVRGDGQEARTEVNVIERFVKNRQKLTKVALKLHTGRTHQIRVHMKWAGHPILGDDLYGGSRRLISRQALHCETLQFNHPISNEPLTFKAALPLDIKRILSHTR